MEIKQIKINKIKPDPNQPRKVFNKGELEGLAKTYKTTGVINAIEIDKNNMIITGERRWKAARIVGFEEIPCKIIEKISKIERFERQVIENVHHNRMNPMEEAEAFKKLLNELFIKSTPKPRDGGGWNKYFKELSNRIGKSEAHISNRLKLLDKPKEIQEDVRKDRKKASYYQENRLKDEKLIKQLDKKILKGDFKNPLDVRAMVNIIKKAPLKVQEAILKDEITPKDAEDIIELPEDRQDYAIKETKEFKDLQKKMIDRVKTTEKIKQPEKSKEQIAMEKINDSMYKLNQKIFDLKKINDTLVIWFSDFRLSNLIPFMKKEAKKDLRENLVIMEKSMNKLYDEIKKTREGLKE